MAMTAPSVCILLLTYDRLTYAEKTLRSALDNIQYSGKLSVHIADDGSSQEYREHLHALAGGYEKVAGVGMTNSERGGYGKNYNLALQQVHGHSDIILPLEDDWELVQPLDLDRLVQVLADEDIGCIRMGYIGYTQELRGKFVWVAGMHFLLFDPDSPEPHVWSGHPRLETKEWQRSQGPWDEDALDPGSTEFAVAQRQKSRQGVVWPLDLIHPRGDLFEHFGSCQARMDQKEAVST